MWSSTRSCGSFPPETWLRGSWSAHCESVCLGLSLAQGKSLDGPMRLPVRCISIMLSARGLLFVWNFGPVPLYSRMHRRFVSDHPLVIDGRHKDRPWSCSLACVSWAAHKPTRLRCIVFRQLLMRTYIWYVTQSVERLPQLQWPWLEYRDVLEASRYHF